MSSPVAYERTGDVASVVLSRPEARNALTPESMDVLAELFSAIAADRSIGAVVLSGAEGFFCSGLDLKHIDPNHPPTVKWMAVHEAIARLEVPLVTALVGGAINAGAALALASDLVIVGKSSFLQVKEAQMGTTPPVNAAWLAMRYPTSVGLQLALTCRRFSGNDLFRLGIALEVVADAEIEECARTLGTQLAAYPKRGAGRTKQALRYARGEIARPFSAVVREALQSRDEP